jgi:excisionase family DNA binding protein
MSADHEAAIRRACDALADALVAAVAEGPAPEPDRLLSIPQAAELLNLSRTSVYAMIGRGELRTLTAGRRRLVPSSAIGELARR